jgi:hypothetical protein
MSLHLLTSGFDANSNKMAHLVIFRFALVGFWFARSDCRVVIGENGS